MEVDVEKETRKRQEADRPKLNRALLQFSIQPVSEAVASRALSEAVERIAYTIMGFK